MRLNVEDGAGGGCVAVRWPLVGGLGLPDRFTPYSYVRGILAHLEEDCDYSQFARAMNDRALFFTVRHHHTDARSRIRNYCQFNATEARRVLANSKK